MCNENDIEDETHFMFYCNQSNDLWEYLYEKICPKYQHFEMFLTFFLLVNMWISLNVKNIYMYQTETDFLLISEYVNLFESQEFSKQGLTFFLLTTCESLKVKGIPGRD